MKEYLCEMCGKRFQTSEISERLCPVCRRYVDHAKKKIAETLTFNPMEKLSPARASTVLGISQEIMDEIEKSGFFEDTVAELERKNAAFRTAEALKRSLIESSGRRIDVPELPAARKKSPEKLKEKKSTYAAERYERR